MKQFGKVSLPSEAFVNLLKKYYFAICSYNVEFAELIFRTGLSLEEFHSTYVSK